MIRKTDRNFITAMKINLSKLVFIKLFIIVILSILTEGVMAQGCSVTLKINDPAPVCSPLTVDLTSSAITFGSTSGLIYSYYLNPQLTVPVTSPSNVNTGTYYIKGVLADPLGGFAAASVKVIVIEKPKLIIANPVVASVDGGADLTLPQISLGSDVGLVFSYWYDSEAKNPLPSPNKTVKGDYFIKGTSGDGCFNIMPITVKN